MRATRSRASDASIIAAIGSISVRSMNSRSIAAAEAFVDAARIREIAGESSTAKIASDNRAILSPIASPDAPSNTPYTEVEVQILHM